jgi:Zn-dependent protease
MLLQQPSESPYDLRFHLFGFPIRIAWGFWVASIIFGFELVRGIENYFGADSPGRLPLLVMWAACLLVSILIHELGHAFAFRRSGTESSIVLYHFGGLAIPRSDARTGFEKRSGPVNDIWISFAGPFAQLSSAMLLAAVVHFAGYRLDAFRWLPGSLERIPGAMDGAPVDSPGLYAMLVFYLLPSIFWALINLLPVLPLDGGQIARSFVMMQGGDITTALWISVIAAGLTAAYGMSIGQTYIAIFFLILGVSSFQALQQVRSSWR